MLCMLPLCLRYLLYFLPKFEAHQPASSPMHNYMTCGTCLFLYFFLHNLFFTCDFVLMWNLSE
jgi:hypothetical protein